MSNAVFPLLRGVTLEYTMDASFSTIVQTTANRSEIRIAVDPYPLWEFDFTVEHLSDDPYYAHSAVSNPFRLTDYELLKGFFLARQGQFDSFLIDLGSITKRTTDSHVRNVQLGVGDGVTSIYQLQRSIGGFMDEIQNPKGIPTILVGSALTAAFTMGTRGQVLFNAPPAAGAIISASFQWYYRVRFSDDKLTLKGLLYQLFECQSLKLTQVRS